MDMFMSVNQVYQAIDTREMEGDTSLAITNKYCTSHLQQSMKLGVFLQQYSTVRYVGGILGML